MNTLITVLFLIFAALILASAILTVTVKNIVHAALWLISSFFGVGALYLLMEAEFLGVAQVLIYVGALSILILFAIMLTRDLEGSQNRQLTPRWWIALIVPAALFGLLIVPTVMTHAWQLPPPPTGQPPAISGAQQIGTAFMREYLLSFEVAAILLTVAMIGAIVIAFEERERRRRVLTLAEQVRLRQQQRQQPQPAPRPEPAATAIQASEATGGET
ncbi:NADH-quinone oxidoreductase subunit J [Roseiflexus sp.]|uniref:NADH-quinone oxidoreductase subunit J family protein n=1 Tax=Roseiflexus sp. TaxID=2562120 RepID=UPI0021DD93D3|nr:NADH-quinone oxidoreductase subunit J [Roseiflexus sp.]GIW01103.1 MAG: NADH-quinone oxidoreductase subunit J [Roseiflexus sp.]